VLVAPWVAAEMTDLLQSAVLSGTGRAAQIGRPVAGKTGTTTLNKDGWFIGFSSGLTTGVWMGRDDAKVVPGLQGGTAPARAFHDFMIKAVAKRPAEAFDTQVTLPEYQLDEENSAYGEPDNGMFVDDDGNPLPEDQQPRGDGSVQGQPGQPQGGQQGDEQLDQDWIDRMTGRRAPAPAPAQPQRDQRDTARDVPRQPAPQPRTDAPRGEQQ
jgi:penicillin-binding protein 1A